MNELQKANEVKEVIEEANQPEIDNTIDNLPSDIQTDTIIFKILEKIQRYDRGVQNRYINKLAKYLEHYGIRDIKQMNKEVEKENQDENLKIQLDEIVNTLLNEFNILTLEDSRDILIKNKTAYLGDIIILEKRIKEELDNLEKGSFIPMMNNILEMIRIATLIKRGDFHVYSDCIIFQSGVADCSNATFYPIENESVKKCKFFYEISHNFLRDKRYNCPKFKGLLRQWIYPKQSLTYFRIRDIFEMIGLSMSLNISFKKSFIPYGDTNTGKTRLTNIIDSLFNQYNKSTTDLHRITKDQFGTDNLQFITINISDDLPERGIKDRGPFKKLTGGARNIQGENKHGLKFNYTCYAKFWFNANKIPKTYDYSDDAWYERFIIIPFLNQFKEGDPDFKLNIDETIINDPNEMQGIIHESVKGFMRLLKRGHFRKKITENTKQIWIYESDPMFRFLYNNCIRISKQRIEWNEFAETFLSEMMVDWSPQKIKKALGPVGLVKRRGSKNNIKNHFVYGIKWNDAFIQRRKEEEQNNQTKKKSKMDEWFN